MEFSKFKKISSAPALFIFLPELEYLSLIPQNAWTFEFFKNYKMSE